MKEVALQFDLGRFAAKRHVAARIELTELDPETVTRIIDICQRCVQCSVAGIVTGGACEFMMTMIMNDIESQPGEFPKMLSELGELKAIFHRHGNAMVMFECMPIGSF